MSKLYEFPTIIHRVFNYNGHIYETIINKDNYSEQINILDGNFIKVSDLIFNSGVVSGVRLCLPNFVDKFVSSITRTKENDVFIYIGSKDGADVNLFCEKVSFYDCGEYQPGRYINMKYLNKFLGYIVFRINKEEFTLDNVYWVAYLVKQYEKTRIKIIEKLKDSPMLYFTIKKEPEGTEKEPEETEEITKEKVNKEPEENNQNKDKDDLTSLISNIISSQNLINQYLPHEEMGTNEEEDNEEDNEEED